MGDWAIQALVFGFFAWVIWSVFLQARYAFEIRVSRGRALLRKGKVTTAFVGMVTELCREHGVAKGWIRGRPWDRRIALKFSRHFPPGLRQRLRNEWQSIG
jgi:hypothetical protein